MKDQKGQQPTNRPGPPNQGPPQPMRNGTPPAPQGNPGIPQPVRNSTPPAPQGNPGIPQQKGNSLRSYATPAPAAESGAPKNIPLTQRYQQGQQPANNAAMPNTPLPPKSVPHTPPIQSRLPMQPQGGPQPGMVQGQNNQRRPQDQIVRTSTPPLPNQPANQGNPHAALWDGPSLDDFYNDPAMLVTSQAAEHWRASWRGRQKAEAGPAVGIARGQAEVAEPLLAMQNSIARMRAVQNTGKKPTTDNSKGAAFWGPIILLSCLIVGLIAYSATTFAGSGTTPTLAASGSNPLLLIKSPTTTFTAGQAIHVIGNRFSANGTVALSLDSGSGAGQAQNVQSNKDGDIDTSLVVPSTALAGNYTLKAIDNTTKGSSFLPIHVLPINTANTTPLQATGTDQLNFTATLANPDPKAQKVITLTNPTDTAVTWSATTFSNYVSTDPKNPIGTDIANWLLLNNGQSSGQLQPQESNTLSISVNAMGLTPSFDRPNTGYVVINTLTAQNQQGQMLLKVSLLFEPTGNELVVTPSTTLVITRDADGTCTQHPPSITLANLGQAPINYTVKASDTNTANFFNFSPNASGVVNPIGSANVDKDNNSVPTDVQSISLTCHNIQAGANLYHISIYPGTSAVITVNITVVAG
jgi:hypothetical protein